MFKLKEIRPNIFLMNFDNGYDLAMHFLRYQEYYEAASPKFRGNSFKILDFMKWYSEKYGDGNFTYPTDWGGFNIPSEVIRNVINIGIPDPNDYDAIMETVYDDCRRKTDKFYLIGVVGENGGLLKHEVAHGLFYTTPEYKKEMRRLVRDLPNTIRNGIFTILKNMGYANTVHVDECQAYMATGLTGPMSTLLEQYSPSDLPENKFITVFNKYYKEKK